jgi:large repetitive protein
MRKRMTFGGVLALLAGLACALGGSAAGKSLDAPTITSVTPTSGMVGSTVVIKGTNLTGATVSFKLKQRGAIAVPVSAANTMVTPDGTQITVVVPDGLDAAEGQIAMPGKNGVWVTTPGGTTVWNMAFVVQKPQLGIMRPIIMGFGPHKAGPGATVTIFGKHFSGTKFVKFAGLKATFRVPSDSRILATVPQHAHSGFLKIKTPAGTAKSFMSLTVVHPEL